MENKTDKMKGKKAVEEVIEMMYAKGKGKYCEICRMRGMKRRAYDERQIDGIDYFVCWDCAGDLWEQEQKRLKEQQNVSNS